MRDYTYIRVRYQETDQMGMAYHANYFVWMEVGRTEMFRRLEMPYKTLEDKGIMLPVIKAECDYKNSAKYDEIIKIVASIERLTPAKINVKYLLYKENGQLAAQGCTTHAFVNHRGKPVNIKKQKPEIYSSLEQCSDLE